MNDYHGFPSHTYELKWLAPGTLELARQAVDMLSAVGIIAELGRQSGQDYGVFIPFLMDFEKADIPTIQISLSADLSPKTHLQMEKLLALVEHKRLAEVSLEIYLITNSLI